MNNPSVNDPSSETRRDQLYRLLPKLYQALDSERVPEDQKGPLRELLSVIGEQVNLLEDDLARWYENWFIETCEDWVVPYLGDLVGYESAAKELNTEGDPESSVNRSVVFPRREVADTIALRRRKGTLALLEELSLRMVGWPARAVEYRRMTAGSASLNHPSIRRSSTVDVRHVGALEQLDTPFDEIPRTVDVRRITSHRTLGRHNLAAVGLFVCRRLIDSATLAPTRACGTSDRRLFDIQGLDVPLHVLPEPEDSPDTIARQIHLPIPLTRSMLRRARSTRERLEHNLPRHIMGANPMYYGIGKSLFVIAKYGDERRLIPASDICVTDLSNWRFFPSEESLNTVAIDPETGRIAFHPDYAPEAVWTTYHYGRPSLLGGGEYNRRTNDVESFRTVFKGARDVGLPSDPKECKKLTVAITEWKPDTNPHCVIEIADNEEHSADFDVTVPKGYTLEIRAANRFRPLLRVPDTSGQEIERCHIRGESGSHLILDGLLFGEGEVLLDGEFSSIAIRHCTFTPGKTHLVIRLNDTDIRITKSILGTIVTRAPDGAGYGSAGKGKGKANSPTATTRYMEPVRLALYDCIVDGQRYDYGQRRSERHATDRELCISGADHWAHVVLTAVRTTLFGEVEVHRVDRIENSIFLGRVCVENCQSGCVRFSYIAKDSCTPKQFHCQPSLAMSRAQQSPETEVVRTPESEEMRVVPKFMSQLYGHPDQARLTDDCAPEILLGADDEGEMGVYHDEFFTQRAIHLRQRLQEFVPAGNDAAIIFEN